MLEWNADAAADAIMSQDYVSVVAHIDADGICAAAIASISLERSGVRHDVTFVKHIDPLIIDTLPDNLVWFVDLGSGSLSSLSGQRSVITDHHHPSGGWPPVDRESRGSLRAYVPPDEMILVNPHLLGLDGAQSISGAGVTYLVARCIDESIDEIAHLAVIGAVGDLQDSRDLRLVGWNRRILETAVRKGKIDVLREIRLFGRETRPLHKMLQYADDPSIPGVSGSEEGALSFLTATGVKTRSADGWRRWIDLNDEEKKRIISALVEHMVLRGCSPVEVRRLMGEVYLLTEEEEGTPLHDAKEFSTLLNACGRYGRAEVGLRILKGDRVDAVNEALDLLSGHRKTLVDAILAVQERGVYRRRHLQYFDAGDAVNETIVGIVAGMLLSSGRYPRDMPMFGFASAVPLFDGEPGGMLKVSARTSREMVARGIDLAEVVKVSAERVGGFGGGHNIAAGGAIPADRLEEFLDIADALISKQMRSV